MSNKTGSHVNTEKGGNRYSRAYEDLDDPLEDFIAAIKNDRALYSALIEMIESQYSQYGQHAEAGKKAYLQVLQILATHESETRVPYGEKDASKLPLFIITDIKEDEIGLIISRFIPELKRAINSYRPPFQAISQEFSPKMLTLIISLFLYWAKLRYGEDYERKISNLNPYDLEKEIVEWFLELQSGVIGEDRLSEELKKYAQNLTKTLEKKAISINTPEGIFSITNVIPVLEGAKNILSWLESYYSRENAEVDPKVLHVLQFSTQNNDSSYVSALERLMARKLLIPVMVFELCPNVEKHYSQDTPQYIRLLLTPYPRSLSTRGRCPVCGEKLKYLGLFTFHSTITKYYLGPGGFLPYLLALYFEEGLQGNYEVRYWRMRQGDVDLLIKGMENGVPTFYLFEIKRRRNPTKDDINNLTTKLIEYVKQASKNRQEFINSVSGSLSDSTTKLRVFTAVIVNIPEHILREILKSRTVRAKMSKNKVPIFSFEEVIKVSPVNFLKKELRNRLEGYSS